MKKIIAFTFFIGFFSSSFAQPNYGRYSDNRNDQYGSTYRQGYYNHGNYFSKRDKDFQMSRIDREFRLKVYSIRRNHFMRHHQKKMAISSAEYERERQMQIVNARFESQYHNDYRR